MQRLALAGPRRAQRLRWLPAQRAERRLGIGNAEEATDVRGFATDEQGLMHAHFDSATLIAHEEHGEQRAQQQREAKREAATTTHVAFVACRMRDAVFVGSV